ncbi:MAG: hypothetical protein IJF84_01780 [Thermoguttaceae bacterium]|nr:hypothetical protein [Thermoguttaceae bacterium]
MFRSFPGVYGYEIMSSGYSAFFILNAETADYSQSSQTGWECGDDANFVVYATIPARFFIIKFIFKIYF